MKTRLMGNSLAVVRETKNPEAVLRGRVRLLETDPVYPVVITTTIRTTGAMVIAFAVGIVRGVNTVRFPVSCFVGTLILTACRARVKRVMWKTLARQRWFAYFSVTVIFTTSLLSTVPLPPFLSASVYVALSL